MYTHVMMYVHEMLSEYVRVWENKSLTIVGDLSIFCQEDILLENKLCGKQT